MVVERSMFVRRSMFIKRSMVAKKCNLKSVIEKFFFLGVSIVRTLFLRLVRNR